MSLKQKSITIPVIVLSMLLLFSIAFGIRVGSVNLQINDILAVFSYKLFNNPLMVKNSVVDIVWLLRFPRVLLAISVGTGLAVSGNVMQAIVKNPLADPYILGVSSGAMLGATLAIMLGVGISFGPNFIGITAFIGALCISYLVMLIANKKGNTSSVRLLLSGMALNSLCSSFSNFIIFISNNKQGIQTITFWLMGSLAGSKWSQVSIILPLMIVLTIYFYSQHRVLNIMLLGDETAKTLGTDLNKERKRFLILSSIMVAFSVYSSGMIGFVGLIIPHLVRLFTGSDHRKTLPLSALLGSLFLLWSDIFCRIIIPNAELPIGILISIIGAPTFLFLLTRNEQSFKERG